MTIIGERIKVCKINKSNKPHTKLIRSGMGQKGIVQRGNESRKSRKEEKRNKHKAYSYKLL